MIWADPLWRRLLTWAVGYGPPLAAFWGRARPTFGEAWRGRIDGGPDVVLPRSTWKRKIRDCEKLRVAKSDLEAKICDYEMLLIEQACLDTPELALCDEPAAASSARDILKKWGVKVESPSGKAEE